MKILVGIILALISGVTQAATTWHVASSGNDSNAGNAATAPLKTIQKAIDKSAAGDTILVSKGTYSYIVVPVEKEPLTIKAVDSVSDCIIKGKSSGTGAYARCATLGSKATTNICLIGFTLTAGCVNEYTDDSNGGGAKYGTLRNCVVTGNRAGSISTAGGVCESTLYDCRIINNKCTDWAGGMQTCIASNCYISGNEGYHGAGGAAGCVLYDCTIVGNKSTQAAGGADGCTLYRCLIDSNSNSSGYYSGCELNGGKAYNCIVKGNGSSRIMAAAECYNCTIVSSLPSPSIWRSTKLYNSIISGSSNGNISINGDSNWKAELYKCLYYKAQLGTYTSKDSCTSADPKFVSGSDLHLQEASPAIDKGNNTFVTTAEDYDRNPRIDNGVVDVGAYEYQHQKPIGSMTIVWDASGCTYSGKAQTIGITVKNGEKVLALGVDYAVVYEGNTNAGVAKAILSGLGIYYGEVTNEFSIAKAPLVVTAADKLIYKGAEPGNNGVFYEGFVNDEDESALGGSLTFDYGEYKAGSAAGEYPITPGGLTAFNYEIEYRAGVLKVVTEPAIEISARQRYPWNGLVDVKFTVVGDAGTKCDVSFAAKDVVGGTNLTMNTLTRSDGTAANVAKEQLSPGLYNWVWNATADLGEGTVLKGVVVEGSAELNEADAKRYMIVNLKSGAVSYMAAEPAGGWANDPYKQTQMVFRRIEAGAFTQSSGASSSRKVTITNPYYIALHAFTAYHGKTLGCKVNSDCVLEYDLYPSSQSGWAASTKAVAFADEIAWRLGQSRFVDSLTGSDWIIGVLNSRTKLSFTVPTEAQLTLARSSMNIGTSYLMTRDYYKADLGGGDVTNPCQGKSGATSVKQDMASNYGVGTACVSQSARNYMLFNADITEKGYGYKSYLRPCLEVSK